MKVLQSILLLSLATVAHSRSLAKGGMGMKRKYPKHFSILQAPPSELVFVDPNEPADVPGLVGVANDDIYDPATGDVLGKARGDCFQIAPACTCPEGQDRYRCTITYEFSAYDSVTILGLYQFPNNGTIAVGGGTGKYKGASGEAHYYNLDDLSIFLDFDLS